MEKSAKGNMEGWLGAREDPAGMSKKMQEFLRKLVDWNYVSLRGDVSCELEGGGSLEEIKGFAVTGGF